MNNKTVAPLVNQLLEVIQESGEALTIPFLLEVYASLGYAIGASIAGGQADSGPDMQTLQKAYYTNPTIDVCLMLQSLLMLAWKEDLQKKPIFSGPLRPPTPTD